MQYDHELEFFLDNYRRFLQEHVAPHYEEWEKQKRIPRSFWNVLGENGFLCVDVPDIYGGYGAPLEYSLRIVQETAKAGFSALAVGMGGQSELVSPYIQHIGSETQKQYWLPRMASGEVVSAIAMTEADAGSDLQSMRTQAVLDGDEYVINGAKTFISNGQNADLIVLAAKTDPDAGAKGISLFLVDASLPGVQKGRSLDKIGLHAQDTIELFFENVRVPKEQLLGEENKGFVYLMQELPRERLNISFIALGATQGALEVTCQYVQERQVFRQKLSSLQNTRFVLGEAHSKVLAANAFVQECLQDYAIGRLTIPKVAALKCFATDIQCEVIDALLQLFGGYGYMTEYPISRFYTDARVQKIYGGTNEIMKEIVARELVGR